MLRDEQRIVESIICKHVEFMSFRRLVVLSTCCFIDLLFHRLVILTTHINNLKECKWTNVIKDLLTQQDLVSK